MLLPWYINGSLDCEQQELVDEHLAVCLTCRSELHTQRRIAQLVQARCDASVGAEIGFAEVCKRIRPAHRTLLGRVRDLSRNTPHIQAGMWVSGAAIAASIFMALPLLHDLGEPAIAPGEYRTLSATDDHLDIRENTLRLMFSTSIADGIQQDILREINAVAVSSASPGGVLTVRVPAGELDSALALLRNRSGVRLAEPVYINHESTGGD